ncbi:hypothetical protein Y1Q_0016109 [Alligator mississippiensis]|uniref:Uncharacterized protein n=1 Tax=Alligator mississippiensis TaxID=8496 RepID=A0A151P1M9_ALLMI|nr:hypothetical protein Y1Q_0016109 [Alligator mississippiensis]
MDISLQKSKVMTTSKITDSNVDVKRGSRQTEKKNPVCKNGLTGLPLDEFITINLSKQSSNNNDDDMKEAPALLPQLRDRSAHHRLTLPSLLLERQDEVNHEWSLAWFQKCGKLAEPIQHFQVKQRYLQAVYVRKGGDRIIYQELTGTTPDLLIIVPLSVQLMYGLIFGCTELL